MRATALGVVPCHDAQHPATAVRAPRAPVADDVRLIDLPEVPADIRISRRFHLVAALVVGAVSIYNVAYVIRAYTDVE